MVSLFTMKLYFLIVSMIISPFIFAGGPWLSSKKSGFFQVQSTFPVGSYNQLFLEQNKTLGLNKNVLDYTFQAYLEYGITDNLNLITTLPYKYISTRNSEENIISPSILPDGELSGFGNYKLALKQRISNKNIKIAISAQTIFNTVSKDLDRGLITGYDANSIGLYLHAGKSFSNGTLYSFIEAGINTQTNKFSDYIELHYELGYQVKPSFWTVLTVDIRESLKGGSYLNENLRKTGFYTNNQEYFAYGIKVSYELKNKVGFTAATFGAFSGNYVAKVATFSLGVYKKW